MLCSSSPAHLAVRTALHLLIVSQHHHPSPRIGLTIWQGQSECGLAMAMGFPTETLLESS